MGWARSISRWPSQQQLLPSEPFWAGFNNQFFCGLLDFLCARPLDSLFLKISWNWSWFCFTCLPYNFMVYPISMAKLLLEVSLWGDFQTRRISKTRKHSGTLCFAWARLGQAFQAIKNLLWPSGWSVSCCTSGRAFSNLVAAQASSHLTPREGRKPILQQEFQNV